MTVFIFFCVINEIIAFLTKAEKKSFNKTINIKVIKNFGGGIYVPYYFCLDENEIKIFKNKFLLTEIKNNFFDFDLVIID